MTSQPRTDPADLLLTVADIAGHSSELKASKFGTRIGYRIRRADYDDFLRRRQLTGTIARQLLSLGTNEPDPVA